mmetsp:Transcript_20369/g.35015  ORF Transcript_20369/g.35015 Transcript_20369/m.35015 type:complete len:275 (+) Transcript_20369:139-963(+)
MPHGGNGSGSGRAPIPAAKPQNLGSSYNALFPMKSHATSQKNLDPEKRALRSRSKQQSPHPADIARGQKQHGSGAMDNNGTPNNQTTLNPQNASPNGTPPNEDIPVFSISNNLESSESAEELRQLIEAMQNEFQRLRTSKMNAEARAEKLQTDLSIQQQQMESHFESLSIENERLKREANEHSIQLDHTKEKVTQLENENRLLRGECDKMLRAREVADAKAVAAELRAAAAEKEVFIEKELHIKERRRRSIVSSPIKLKRVGKEPKASKPRQPP